MSSQRFVRKEMLPSKWCPGCGLHILFAATHNVLDKLNKTNTVVVSGIGCTGRGAAYFNLDSVHGLHGRAIPLAVGIKAGNPKLNVMVFSGDGDLLGIGLNHLIHAARRNDDITVICNNNNVLAMTGGQASPTTEKGSITKNTPYGNTIAPIDAQKLLLTNEKYFYARTSTPFQNHLKECITAAIKHKGFSFVELRSPCLINYARQTGKNAGDMMIELKQRYKISNKNRKLKDNELGIVTR